MNEIKTGKILPLDKICNTLKDNGSDYEKRKRNAPVHFLRVRGQKWLVSKLYNQSTRDNGLFVSSDNGYCIYIGKRETAQIVCQADPGVFKLPVPGFS